MERIANALERLVEIHSEMLSFEKIRALDTGKASKDVKEAADRLQRHISDAEAEE
jgi:hypothetical protein